MTNTFLRDDGTFQNVSGSQLLGTTTNDNANTGNVGEFQTLIIPATTISLSSTVTKDIGSLSLAAGDYDVWGAVNCEPAGVISFIAAWVSIIPATPPGFPAEVQMGLSFTSAFNLSIPVLMQRFSLSALTPIYLSTIVTFTSTCTAGGVIYARRRR